MIADDSDLNLGISPRAFLAAATALLGAGGLLAVDVPSFLAGDGGDGAQSTDAEWDAAFVQHAGYCSQYDHARGTSAWPLPQAESAEELAGVARVLGMIRLEPQPADIFTTWSGARREFMRTGIVVAVTDRRVEADGTYSYECLTLEGNLNVRADARGALVRRVRRRLSADRGDRFIRWTEAGGKGVMPTPVVSTASSSVSSSETAPLRRAA